MLKEILQSLVAEKKRAGAPDFVIKNFLKEYLQYPVLDFIYNSSRYRGLVFTGGSCLRVCFNAPRLSEDLDFDLPKPLADKIDVDILGVELKRMFIEKYLLSIEVRRQGKGRLYLKFPILKDLGIAAKSESDLLYVKLELEASPFIRPTVEVSPVSKYGYNFVARNYSLPFLFVGKIKAFLSRVWFKGGDNEVDIKGRDFYDLYWFLSQGVEPDWRELKRLVKIDKPSELEKVLRAKISRQVTAQKLAYDLKNFFPDQNFVQDFCKNYPRIIAKYLSRTK